MATILVYMTILVYIFGPGTKVAAPHRASRQRHSSDREGPANAGPPCENRARYLKALCGGATLVPGPKMYTKMVLYTKIVAVLRQCSACCPI